MPQNEHIERSIKLHGEAPEQGEQERCGRRQGCGGDAPQAREGLGVVRTRTVAGRKFDHEERKRKKSARAVHKRAEEARKAIGLKGKMLAKKRYAEKAQMRKTIAMHEEKDSKRKAEDGAPENALPAYLLERDQVRPEP